MTGNPLNGMQDYVRRASLLKAQAEERIIKRLFERWVSELEPAIAVDDRGEIIGLTWADYPVGTEDTFILMVEET